MTNPLDKALPRKAPLTEMQLRLLRYGNVKTELLGAALAYNQATTIINDYSPTPPASASASKRKLDDDEDDPMP